jgi:hypothetical protein
VNTLTSQGARWNDKVYDNPLGILYLKLYIEETEIDWFRTWLVIRREEIEGEGIPVDGRNMRRK